MTSAPFVTDLRTNGDLIRLGSDDEPVLHIRVQVAELWDSVRIDAPASEKTRVVDRVMQLLGL